jgi:formylglycine-generating enzyme required for sulfatase activity/tRNA A-37 threonylcarbamoyl transferase component Bud32
MPLNPGQILQGRYVIQALLGQGGMGAVYRAHDQTLNRAVAVKERVPDSNASAQGLAQARAQFQREAQVLAALSHPNLPHTYDYFSFGANEYVVMELIEGQSLDQIVQQHGAIGEGAVRAWAEQVLDALAYIHSRNIIHRDIKPANIILKPDGKVVLVDFGLVKLVDPNNPYTITAMRGMGTPEYAPLEQFSPGMHTDARSDLYSFGATLYHLLSGRAPLDVPRRLLNPAAQPALRAINVNISPQTEWVAQKAMEVYPQNRFQSAAEMRQAMMVAPTIQTPPRPQPQPYVPSAPTATPAVPVVPAPRPQRRVPPVQPAAPVPTARAGNRGRRAWMAVSVVVMIVIAGIGATIWIGRLNFLDLLVPAPTLIPAEMVSVLAGEFKMGSSDADRYASDDEKPQHTVYLDAFWIDKYEVTNALYKKCVDAGKCQSPNPTESYSRRWYYGISKFDNYPVIYVSWNDAKAYCEWAGKRLPTEAEWEKAARGTDGRIYPWGNAFDKNRLNSSEGGRGDTTPVDSFPSGASPYGALDMAGNVWEWVADWHDSAYYTNSPRNNPKGPSSGQYRVLRGGAWNYGQRSVRAASRDGYDPGTRIDYVGFRCAQ